MDTSAPATVPGVVHPGSKATQKAANTTPPVDDQGEAVIVYQASKRQFIRDTFHDDIEFVLLQQRLRGRLGLWADAFNDPKTRGSYTIKRHQRERLVAGDGSGRHERVELVPERDGGDEVMAINAGGADSASVVAELRTVL